MAKTKRAHDPVKAFGISQAFAALESFSDLVARLPNPPRELGYQWVRTRDIVSAALKEWRELDREILARELPEEIRKQAATRVELSAQVDRLRRELAEIQERLTSAHAKDEAAKTRHRVRELGATIVRLERERVAAKRALLKAEAGGLRKVLALVRGELARVERAKPRRAKSGRR